MVELLVVLLITVIVATLVYLTLEVNSNITRVQTSVSFLQQSVRYAQRDMARRIRMTGRSGLPRDLAISVQQNVAPGTTVAGVEVVAGTDIVKIRGAFSSPIWRVDAGDASTFVIDGTTATILVDSVTKSGFLQAVDQLADAVANEAIMMVSRQADTVWAVGELIDVTVEPGLTVMIQNQPITVNRATVRVNIDPGSGTYAAQYLAMSSGNGDGTVVPGTFPTELTSALYLSIVEEYRYFIQEEFAVEGDPSSLLTPKLVMARMTPNTELVYQGDAALASQNIAENVSDLQIALGYDLDADGRVLMVEDDDGNPVPAALDEWYHNDAADDSGLAWNLAPLQYIRVSMIARASAPDLQYIAPALATHYDRVYNEASQPSGVEAVLRRYRRRQLENLIDLRNI